MQHIDDKVEVARISGAVAGVTIYGITLNEWVAIATLVYLILQMVILGMKIRERYKGWRNNEKSD